MAVILRGSVLSFDWFKSPEGQGLLAHLTDPSTGYRKLYGLLEQPNLPPSIEQVECKLFVVGRSGCGKTCTASWLAGLPGWNCQPGESPGVRTTVVYWPARVHTKLVLFKLNVWDAGESANRKYSHVYPVCKEEADGVLVVFSFSDRAGWEELPSLLQRTAPPQENITPIVVGTKYGNIQENEVSGAEVTEFEKSWNVPVVRVRYQSQTTTPPSVPDVAVALNTICEQLWLSQKRPKHLTEPDLI